MPGGTDIEGALDRLDAWLSSTREGRTVSAGLRPPATNRDIDELRDAIDPYEVPPELAKLLRWHNGEDPRSRPPHLLPLDDGGPLLGTTEIAVAYHWLLENLETWQWNPLWVPVLKHRHQQLAVVLEGPRVILHNDFGNAHLRVLSSSLPALMHATADIAEAGFLTDLPYRECRSIIDSRADQFGWDGWRYGRQIENDLNAANWPQRWREARGLRP